MTEDPLDPQPESDRRPRIGRREFIGGAAAFGVALLWSPAKGLFALGGPRAKLAAVRHDIRHARGVETRLRVRLVSDVTQAHESVASPEICRLLADLFALIERFTARGVPTELATSAVAQLQEVRQLLGCVAGSTGPTGITGPTGVMGPQ